MGSTARPTLRLPGAGCPCGSGESYAGCCGVLHRQPSAAQRAEQVMRARYSAFVRGDEAFLRVSWDPATRPADTTTDPAITWTRLEILEVAAGDAADVEGQVEFIAHYVFEDRPGTLHERSHFRRGDDGWCYVGPARRRR